MCVIHPEPPVSANFLRSFGGLLSAFKVSEYPSNYYLDSSELWSGVPDADGNDYIAALFQDIKWGSAHPDEGETTDLSYYIYDDEFAQYNFDERLHGQSPREEERNAILNSMDAFAAVTGLTFAETSDKDEANISFLMMNDDDSNGNLGWANYPGTSPEGVTYSTINNEMYNLDNDPEALDPG